jgi:predicted MPP superfamily phosphohydrolase
MTVALRSRGLPRAALIAINGVVALGYALTFSELDSHFGLSAHTATTIGAITLFYLIEAAVIMAVSLLAGFIGKRLPKDTDMGRRRLLLGATGGLLAAAPVAVIGYGTFIERWDFRVREADLEVPELPADLEGLRLVQLSDIHLSAFLSEADLARVVDAANGLDAHIALVTGDLISSHGDPLDACIRQLARLKSTAGTFGCLGNHEHYAGAENYATQAGARSGIVFLRAAARPLRFGGTVLNLAGVDYQSTQNKANYLKEAAGLKMPGAVNMLLSHNPDVLPVAARQGWDAMLSGHTHGGQIAIEILDRSLNPARFFTPYVYGLFRAGRTAAYVTRGIGTIGIPTRIGAPPEIVLARLRRA